MQNCVKKKKKDRKRKHCKINFSYIQQSYEKGTLGCIAVSVATAHCSLADAPRTAS